MTRTTDEWAAVAYEMVNGSDVAAQAYSTFDEGGNPLGVTVQRSRSKGEADLQMCMNFDLKRAFSEFLESGDDAVIYLSKVVAGFTFKELTEKTGGTMYAVRKSVDAGRSVWGTYLHRLGIHFKWE